MTAATVITPRVRWLRLIYFFPFQLLWVHLKRNHLLLFQWVLLFGIITQQFGTKYGVPSLFLYPEYLGKVNFTSHLILGFAIGGFIMSFNIASYIINGHRFPFIATLARPFTKYCINNFIIPISFLLTYLYSMIDYQLTRELESIFSVMLNLGGFILGITLFTVFCLTYFQNTNKNIFKLKDKDLKNNKKNDEDAVKNILYPKQKWPRLLHEKAEWRVETYLVHPMKISLARGSEHYDKTMLAKAISQNHFNASLFEIIVIVSVLLLGFFREVPGLMIPAAASGILFFTMILMFTSALHSWLKGWSTIIFIGLLVGINFLPQVPGFHILNPAYGMDYTVERAEYSYENLVALRDDTAAYRDDVRHGIGILENWKSQQNPNQKKPKLLLVNTSGGGLRAAMWTFLTFQELDRSMGGNLMQQMHLITGSSGGMMGAAYFRELYVQKLQENQINLSADSLLANIGKDILNPVMVTLTVNDLFFRLQKFEVDGVTYTKDRAYAFEKQFHENTGWILDKRLYEYTGPEQKAQIPMMILAPTILNDGRRLVISSQPVSFLCNNHPDASLQHQPLAEAVEFSRMFKEQNAQNLKYSTALRMSATFPYILPNVTLPSEPEIEVIDAGVRDNFGLVNTLKYLHTFRDWIRENTSGVVILQIKDQSKVRPIGETARQTFFAGLSKPAGVLYNKLTEMQSYNQDDMLQFAGTWFDHPVEIVEMALNHGKNDRISLSWHLTRKEKQRIRESINSTANQQAISRLIQLLSSGNTGYLAEAETALEALINLPD